MVQNKVYRNNQRDVRDSNKVALSCHNAGQLLPCSSCLQLWSNPCPAHAPPGYKTRMHLLSLTPQKGEKVAGLVLPAPALSKAKQTWAKGKLYLFACQQRNIKQGDWYLHRSSAAFWSDKTLNCLLNALHLIHTMYIL